MSTNYPTSLDTLTNPSASDNTVSVPHASQHANANDAIEALQTKVGITGSAVAGSIDYKLTNASSSNPGHKHTLAQGATDVTASASEVNQLAGVTVGGTTSGDIVDLDTAQTMSNKKHSGDFDLTGATDNITVNGANPTKIVSFDAGDFVPYTTNGCGGPTKVEHVTSSLNYYTLDFDASADESAGLTFRLPDNWDGGSIHSRYAWTNTAGTSGETLAIDMRAGTYGDGDALNSSLISSVENLDTWIAQNVVHLSGWSGAIPMNSATNPGELLYIHMYRDVSQDTLTGDANILYVQIKYGVSQLSN